MTIKRLTSILLCLCLVFFSVPVSGEVANDFIVRVIEGEEDGYTYTDGVLSFASDGAYEVSMAEGVATTTDVIVVASGVTVEVTINNLKINSGTDNAFSVAVSAVCELELMGDNEFTVSESYAAVHVPADAAIAIIGEGSLKAINSSSGAGIGGDDREAGGSITINGGIIDARSHSGAGIGGGYEGASGTIEINGGTIDVRSYNGAGIGSGSSDSGTTINSGSITIRDGSITAYSTNGAAIGGGYCSSGGEIAIQGGQVIAESVSGAGIGSGLIPGVISTIDNGCITISDGNISAYSKEGAGIGGGLTSSGGEIIILGGIIHAESDEGAGIGSGQYSGYTQSIGTKVTINGGTITAKALQGSGIGGGYRGIGGEVYIRGGSVLASTASATAEAIGHGKPYGADSLNSGVLLDKPGGSQVYLTEFETEFTDPVDLANEDIVFGGAAAGYGTTSLRTDADGKLYFYLPAGLAAARYDDDTYIADVRPAIVNLFQLSPELTTAAGTKITTLPHFNAAAVTYTNPNFNVGANETELATSVSGGLPIILAKMDNAVYPEPVKLTVSIFDASSQSGMDTIEAIDRSIASALVAAAPNPAILAKAERLLILDFVLSLESDESGVQPVRGKVTMSLPIPEGYDPAKMMLAHRKADGTIEFLDITIEDGWITFSTDSFSNFIVLELNMPLAEFMPPPPPDDQVEPSGGATPTENDEQSGGGAADAVDRIEDDQDSTGGSDDSTDNSLPVDNTLPADADQLPKMGEEHVPFSSFTAILTMAFLLTSVVVLRKKFIRG